MNRFFVFLGLVALFVLVSNVEMFAFIEMIDGSAFLWIGGALLFYSIFVGKGCGTKKCTTSS